MANPGCTLPHEALVRAGRTQNRLWRGSELRRFVRLRLKLKYSTIWIRLFFSNCCRQNSKIILTHAYKQKIVVPHTERDKFHLRLNSSLWRIWLLKYPVSVVHTNKPPLPPPPPPPPPDPKNKINFIGAVSKICGFGVRIHWIRVDGRSIRVRFQKYPDSFRRGLQDF